MDNSDILIDKLQQIIDAKIPEIFIQSYINETDKQTLDEEALGVLVSLWTEWDGLSIMRVFISALEDANFHSASEEVTNMLEKYEMEYEKETDVF